LSVEIKVISLNDNNNCFFFFQSLIYASPVPESKRKDYDEDASVFIVEMLLKITVQNRDRALVFWDTVREHLYAMILAAASNDMPYLLERSTVGLMRVALRLMRKEDLCPIVRKHKQNKFIRVFRPCHQTFLIFVQNTK